MTVEVKVPRIYEDVFLNQVDHRVILHAPMNCRVVEVIMAMALQDLMNGKKALIVGPNLTRARAVLQRWYQNMDVKLGKLSSWTFTLGTGTLHFQQGTEILPDDLPIVNPDRVYGLECQSLQSPIPKTFPLSASVLAGLLAEPHHWFYNHAREHEPLKIDEDLIRSTFKDQEVVEVDSTDPYYERYYKIEDVPPKWGSSSFLTFARGRLKIRTDKPRDVLSEKQRQEAAGQAGTPVVSFEVSPLQKRYLAQKRLARMQGKKPWYVLLKYRRGGFTTVEQGLSYHLCVSRPRSSVITLAHTAGSTKRIFRIAALYHEYDPKAQKLLGDSKTELEFENHSTFFIGTAGGRGVARGDTLDRVHGSEVSKWCEGPNQMDLVEDLTAGLLGAASNGEVVLESTPNGREWFYQCYKDATKGLNDFTPIFLRWFDDPMNRAPEGTYNADEIIETLSNEEAELVEKFDLDAAQIAFRREAKRTYKRLFPQEMPEDDESCFISSGVCFFDVDLIYPLCKACPDPIREVRHGEYGYERIWEEPQAGVKYVAGVDTSEGLPGCDRSGVGVLRKDTGEQVCSLHGYFDPRKLADHAVRIAKRYNNALLGIERQNHGHAVLQRVVDLKYSKPHFRGGSLYYFIQNKSDINKSKPGWSTDAQTRPVMLDQLAEAIEGGHMTVRDADLLDECLSFRLQKGGKFEADSGAYDDSVMKWAIAWQMYNARIIEPRISVA